MQNAPRAKPANRGTARKACNASPMRVPPSQSATRSRPWPAPGRGFRRRARVTRVSRVPSVKISMPVRRARERVGEAQMRVGAILHRAGHIDQEQNATWRLAPLQHEAGGSTSPSSPYRFAQRAAHIQLRRARLRLARRRERRRGKAAGAARWKRRRISFFALARNAARTAARRRSARFPTVRPRRRSGGSMPPSRSSKAGPHLVVRALPPAVAAIVVCPRKRRRNRASNASRRSGGGASVATAARCMSLIDARTEQTDAGDESSPSVPARPRSRCAATASAKLTNGRRGARQASAHAATSCSRPSSRGAM